MIPILLGVPGKLKILIDRGLKCIEYFTPGNSQFQVPSNVYILYVTLQAAGGAGGHGYGYAYGGGGSGGTILQEPFVVIPGSIIITTVGAGGEGVTNENVGGGNGGATGIYGISTLIVYPGTGGGLNVGGQGGSGGGISIGGVGGSSWGQSGTVIRNFIGGASGGGTGWANGGSSITYAGGTGTYGGPGGGASYFAPGGNGSGGYVDLPRAGIGAGGSSLYTMTGYKSGSGGHGYIRFEWFS